MDAFPLEYAWRLLAAVACGGLIGLERELQDKPVGLRSNILICLGAALFTLVSDVLTGDRGDPSRVAGQLVTGIGFLGAGAILRQGERIQGITTAATIWLVASLGLASGAGLLDLAAAGTVLALAVLTGFRWVEGALESVHNARSYAVSFGPGAEEAGETAVEEVLREGGLRVVGRQVEVVEGRRRRVLRVVGRAARHDRAAERLSRLPGLAEMRVH